LTHRYLIESSIVPAVIDKVAEPPTEDFETGCTVMRSPADPAAENKTLPQENNITSFKSRS